MIKDVFGLIYAGEENHNLRELVLARSVAALPIGGRYRAIDFPLSNIVNSGIRNVGIITQKNYQSLMDHVGSGKEWDLSRKTDGLFMLPPFDNAENTGIYRGMSDAIKGNLSYIKRASQPFCLLMGASSIYTTTYNHMLKKHVESKADITMLYNVDKREVDDSGASRDLRLYTDEDGWVTEMDYNFKYSNSNKVSMDVFLIHKSLLEYLIDRSVAHGHYDFISDAIMKNVRNLRVLALEHKGYVGRLDSINAYYQLNMDMLQDDVQRDLFYTGNPIYTKIKDEAPVKYGVNSSVKNSLLANGCVIDGEVEDSMLFRGVHVGKGTKIKGCVIMQECEIDDNCTLEHVIADKNCHIREGRRLAGDISYPSIIRKGSVL
jgi:glucose-1-phosphate adenylyltransferase